MTSSKALPDGGSVTLPIGTEKSSSSVNKADVAGATVLAGAFDSSGAGTARPDRDRDELPVGGLGQCRGPGRAPALSLAVAGRSRRSIGQQKAYFSYNQPLVRQHCVLFGANVSFGPRHPSATIQGAHDDPLAAERKHTSPPPSVHGHHLHGPRRRRPGRGGLDDAASPSSCPTRRWATIPTLPAPTSALPRDAKPGRLTRKISRGVRARAPPSSAPRRRRSRSFIDVVFRATRTAGAAGAAGTVAQEAWADSTTLRASCPREPTLSRANAGPQPLELVHHSVNRKAVGEAVRRRGLRRVLLRGPAARTEGTDRGARSTDLGARSTDLGARSRHLGARSRHLGARSTDLGARSTDLGARSKHLGTRSKHLGTPASTSVLAASTSVPAARTPVLAAGPRCRQQSPRSAPRPLRSGASSSPPATDTPRPAPSPPARAPRTA